MPARTRWMTLLFTALAVLPACAETTPAPANNSEPVAPEASPVDFGWLAEALTSDNADTRTSAVIRVAALSADNQARLQGYMRERGAPPLRPVVADSLAENAEGQAQHLVAAGWLGWPMTQPLPEAERHQRLLHCIRQLIACGDGKSARTLCDTRLAADYPPDVEAELAALREKAGD